jgi:hypothetical protein
LESMIALLVSRVCFVPSEFITQRSLFLSKAILEPSADQAAPLSFDVLSVSGGSGSSGTVPPFGL